MTNFSKLNLVELKQQVVDLKKKLAEMRFDKATGKLIDSSSIGKAKKDLARVLTKINQVASN